MYVTRELSRNDRLHNQDGRRGCFNVDGEHEERNGETVEEVPYIAGIGVVTVSLPPVNGTVKDGILR